MIRELLNTLFVLTQGAYVHVDHQTVRVEIEGQTHLQVPMHHLGGIAVFGNVMLSPALIQRFAQDGRSIVWYDSNGMFQGRLVGPTSGNVLLRLAQYEAHGQPAQALHLSTRVVGGKLRNKRILIDRFQRDLGERVPELESITAQLRSLMVALRNATNLDEVRGIEGHAAALYFEHFPLMIKDRDVFPFQGRNRHPPRDPVNALLSFGYSLLTGDYVSALEGVGLDPQVGFLHTIRPGRPALALDLMEELRPMVDRLVLTLLNRRQLQPDDFVVRLGGAVHLTDRGRRVFLAAYQQRKQDEVQHPLLKAKIPFGLVPHIQARLLARYLRGDAQEYRPFPVRS